jgi:WD40 repeat protein
MLTASHEEIRRWDLQTGKSVAVFKPAPRTRWTVAFTRNGQHALTGCEDGTLKLWDFRRGKAVWVAGKHKGVVYVALSGDGKRALSGGGDGAVCLWDAGTARAPGTDQKDP